jgi:hypothetical protein
LRGLYYEKDFASLKRNFIFLSYLLTEEDKSKIRPYLDSEEAKKAAKILDGKLI